MTKSDPWDRIMENAYGTLQVTFDETCETYLEQNPGIGIEEAEKKEGKKTKKKKKPFDDPESNNGRALITVS